MSEAWPVKFCASACDFYMQKNTTRFPSPITKTIQTLDRPGRRWIGRFVFKGKGRKFGQQMDALLDRGDSFLLWDMRRPVPLNGSLSGVALNAARLRGNTTITIDGLPVSQTHLVEGDYVGIGGKLYRLVEDVVADGSGVGTLELNRGLLEDAADNAEVTTRRPTCEMLLQDDDQPSSMVDAHGFHEYNISVFEAL